MAGLGAIYSLWVSQEIRDRNPVSKSILSLQVYASTLSALAESFPGAGGCRDAFESISSATIDWLVTNKTEHRSPETSEFEKQVGGILARLQPSSKILSELNSVNAENISNMLSPDAFSDMLNLAAQWPDHQDTCFSNEFPAYDHNW